MALRHLEETAKIQKMVYFKQLSQINERVKQENLTEMADLIDNHMVNNPKYSSLAVN